MRVAAKLFRKSFRNSRNPGLTHPKSTPLPSLPPGPPLLFHPVKPDKVAVNVQIRGFGRKLFFKTVQIVHWTFWTVI